MTLKDLATKAQETFPAGRARRAPRRGEGAMSPTRQPAGDAARAGRRARPSSFRGGSARRRDLGDLIFLTLRDRSGLVQVVFDRQRCPAEAVAAAAEARSEDVVAIEGEVVLRATASATPSSPTGEVEVVASRLEFLSRAETPPFVVEDRTNATEELRLEYRYLDLRRPAMQKNFVLRDEIAFRVRRVLHERGFLEIETPMLTRSTPEGARDFLVPSRVHRGQWYALPQSPQLFKQILMISGFEKYFQIARCFRDEDLRADRQFEFTQIDLEMSFPTEEDVFDTVEAFLVEAFAAAGIAAARPFPRLTYREAMDTYGTDRPDLRYELPLCDLSAAAAGSGFAPFEKALAGGGTVRGLRVPGGAAFSRKRLDELTEKAREHGAAGLLWVKSAGGEITSPAKKALSGGAPPELLAGRRARGRRPAADRGGLGEGGASRPSRRCAPKPRGSSSWSTSRRLCLLLGHGVPPPGSGRGRRAVVPDEPSLHGAARGGPGAAGVGSRQRARPGLRRRGQRLGARLRLDPDPPRGPPGARLPAARDLGEEEGRERFGFLLDALRYGAPPARRHRPRARPDLRDRGRAPRRCAT